MQNGFTGKYFSFVTAALGLAVAGVAVVFVSRRRRREPDLLVGIDLGATNAKVSQNVQMANFA